MDISHVTIVSTIKVYKHKLLFIYKLKNQQKRAKKARHEQEKAFMEQLRGASHAVGEYVGGGRGDIEEEMGGIDEEDAVHEEVDCHLEEEEEEEDSIENAHPLLFFFDTETTGLNIYQDHIVEIAAKVVGAPSARLTQPSFSSLVHTPRNIPSKGIYIHLLYS